MKVMNIAGNRINFVKIAALMAAYGENKTIKPTLVYTGSEYQSPENIRFFSQLGISLPEVNLGVGPGSQAMQTAAVMTAFEDVLLSYRPDVLVLVGDTNSTLAAALVAVKLGVPVAHVSAGLRSFDRKMPDEINRILIDSISDLLFCSEQSAVDNLLRAGIAEENILLVGNVIIDTLLRNLTKVTASKILDELGIQPERYALFTLHKQQNVDNSTVFNHLLDALQEIQRDMPVLISVRPQAPVRLWTSPLVNRFENAGGLRTIDMLDYLDFMKLMACAKVVLTDSGDMQEETTILQVPCLTLLDSTERPVTVELGTNRVVGTSPENILEAYHKISTLKNGGSQVAKLHAPPLWDGNAARRITRRLLERYGFPSESGIAANQNRSTTLIKSGE